MISKDLVKRILDDIEAKKRGGHNLREIVEIIAGLENDSTCRNAIELMQSLIGEGHTEEFQRGRTAFFSDMQALVDPDMEFQERHEGAWAAGYKMAMSDLQMRSMTEEESMEFMLEDIKNAAEAASTGLDAPFGLKVIKLGEGIEDLVNELNDIKDEMSEVDSSHIGQ
jgi:hypothetical protein